MTNRASGTFDVKITPMPPDREEADPNLGRMTLDKQYHGDLEANSQGQMLTAGTAVTGSAAYVAIEKVSGTLGGWTGTFMLQHKGIMNRGEGRMDVTVVPDSGTVQLAGIQGRMDIKIAADGGHSYTFDYTLVETS